MKAYTVEWDNDASDQLALLFLHVADPNAIWPAQYRADRQLEQRPRQAGSELSEGLWQMTEPPLKISYEINDALRIVTVTHVRLF